MKWISILEAFPAFSDVDEDISKYVWVTNGRIIEISQYVFDPPRHGCSGTDEDWHFPKCCLAPHWHKDPDTASFVDGGKCGRTLSNSEITHWMPLPKPPDKKDG
jgi:hypothetical protein